MLSLLRWLRHEDTEVWFARFFFWGGWVGLLVCMPLWLAGIISTRALVGITLALSWLALIIEGHTGTEAAKRDSDL